MSMPHAIAPHYQAMEVALSPKMSAELTTRALLRRQLDVMLANEAGVLAREDPEHLHDFRIAIRRTRAALSQIKGVFSPPILQRFKPSFAWLGQLTSAPRDLDVLGLKLSSYCKVLPKNTRKMQRQNLRHYLDTTSEHAFEALQYQLTGVRYRELMADWQSFLDRPGEAHTRGSTALRPVGDVAHEHIERMRRRVLRDGHAIGSDSLPDELHELRKNCKKLRYLIEFFATLFGDGHVRKTLSTMKALQENLGDYQDCSVHYEMLHYHGSRCPDTDPNALQQILAGILVQRAALRCDFDQRFQHFASKTGQKPFKSLFG